MDMFEHVSSWSVMWNESPHEVSREWHNQLRDRRNTSKCRPLAMDKTVIL